MKPHQRLYKSGSRRVYHPKYSSAFTLLQHHARTYTNRAAIVAVDIDTNDRNQLTYAELLRLACQTANWLKSLGIKPDARFAISMHNSLDILLFELAGSLIGATTVPLDTKRDTPERQLFKLKNTGCRHMFTHNMTNQERKLLSTQVSIHSFTNLTKLKSIISKFSSVLTHPINHLKNNHLILYTSGTTALPKGVPITTLSLFANAESIIDWQKIAPTDKFNIVLPLHHINSTTISLATLIAGGTVVLNSRYSTTKFWQVVAQEQATITSIVPTILHDLLVRYTELMQTKPDISSMTRMLIGSSPVLPKETNKFYQTYGIRVYQGYGQTETALRVTGVPITNNERFFLQLLKENTIGTELVNNNVTILKDDGKPAQEKEEGEICIRGPVVTAGYWKLPKENKSTFKHGWFHSGDLGYYRQKNGQKFFYIKGRLKEIIIKGGINISPSMIEDALLKNFPEIDEVSVVGYPDERMGEEIAAVIVSTFPSSPKLTQKILDFAIKNQISGLSSYEMPKKVFLVDKLPKTSTGKIQRTEVKKMIADKIKKISLLHYFVRQLKPSDTKALKQAVIINNSRWHGLPATDNEFKTRAKNALLFGVFDDAANLHGSISCLRLNLTQVKNLKTWNQATASGTLTNHVPDGNTLLCIAISVKFNLPIRQISPTRQMSQIKLKQLATHNINSYLKAGKDHVIKFHGKPKGGLPGAKVWKILPQGRVDDKESMGYNVLMKYPYPTKADKIIKSHDRPSIMLIEQVLDYAKKRGIKNVIAFSRPAGFRDYLLNRKS